MVRATYPRPKSNSRVTTTPARCPVSPTGPPVGRISQRATRAAAKVNVIHPAKCLGSLFAGFVCLFGVLFRGGSLTDYRQ